MQEETKQCQNCKSEFIIEPEDFEFYEKIKVPPPTFCPDCRLQQQLMFRNERSLYKRKCDAPDHNEELISIYSPDKDMRVYDKDYWWSDNWDPLQYGRKYNLTKSFFEQFRNLINEVPWPNLVNINSVNSDYCNSVIDMKNSYLVFGAGWSEDTFFATNVDYAKDSMELYSSIKDELCYELLFCDECYKVFFSGFSVQCHDSMFLWDCRGCSNCFGCVGLRKKQYHIFNKSYSKDEYDEKIKMYNIGSYKTLCQMIEEFNKFRINYPHKYARITHSVNASGDNLTHAKNVSHCFGAVGKGLEDSKYIVLSFTRPVKDSQSVYSIGDSASLIYNSASILNANLVLFSKKIWTGHHIQYSYNCNNCSNLFGCIGLRHKQYCILNKQYTEEEYKELVPKIIDHMNDEPYTDKKGRVYKYGEFFPSELSPFTYNETIAQEYFPLTKKQALEKGYIWKDPEKRDYRITIKAEDLPDNIKDVKDDILDQIIGCEHQGKCNEQCTEAFKIIPQELEFYKKMNLSLPRLCPNCRHYQRTKQRNPLKLWHRKCQCAGEQSDNGVYKNTINHSHHGKEHCPNEFETTYSPDRKEIVYCEKCYQQEVV